VNASRHPTIDQIADLDAGVLPAADAGEVSAHLDACASCRDVVTALADVRTLLVDHGRTVPPIPADVATAVDAALERTRAEQAAGVMSLSEHRKRSDLPESPSPSPRRRPGRLVLGAAAAIAVFAVGGAVVDQLGLLHGSQSDSAATAAAEGTGGDPGAGTAKDGSQGYDSGSGPDNPALRIPRSAAPTLDQNNVAAYAAGLASAAVPVASPPTRCSPGGVQPQTSTGEPREALVSFDGSRAVLRLDRQHRQFTVYACPGPERVLYRSSY